MANDRKNITINNAAGSNHTTNKNITNNNKTVIYTQKMQQSTSSKVGGFFVKQGRNLLLLMSLIFILFYFLGNFSTYSHMNFFSSSVEVDTDGDGVLEVYEKKGAFDSFLGFMDKTGSLAEYNIRKFFGFKTKFATDNLTNLFASLPDNVKIWARSWRCECASCSNNRDGYHILSFYLSNDGLASYISPQLNPLFSSCSHIDNYVISNTKIVIFDVNETPLWEFRNYNELFGYYTKDEFIDLLKKEGIVY